MKTGRCPAALVRVVALLCSLPATVGAEAASDDATVARDGAGTQAQAEVEAQLVAEEGAWSAGSVSIIIENDSPIVSDRDYTNGFKLSYLSGVREDDGPTRWLGSKLLWAGDTDLVRFGLAAGQSIFTPRDTGTRRPLPKQHPYAGWLYVGFSLLVESESTLDTLVLELGVVGPLSGGEWVQRNYHRWIGVDDPKGWHNQLKNEFGAVLTYDRKWRTLIDWEVLGLELDATPNAGFSAGNVLTQANAGLTLRIGNDLRSDYGPPRVRPSLAGSGLLIPRDHFSAYLFAGVSGRAVAHNIFLDGNTTRNSLSVDRNIMVGEIQAGIVLQIHRFQLGFTAVMRSKEFETQKKEQIFGALSLTMKL